MCLSVTSDTPAQVLGLPLRRIKLIYLTAEPELSAHVSVSIIDRSATDANRQSGTVFDLSGSLSGMLHFNGNSGGGFSVVGLPKRRSTCAAAFLLALRSSIRIARRPPRMDLHGLLQTSLRFPVRPCGRPCLSTYAGAHSSIQVSRSFVDDSFLQTVDGVPLGA